MTHRSSYRKPWSVVGWASVPAIALVTGAGAAQWQPVDGPDGPPRVTVYASQRADGTIVDGGPYGPFDGKPDHWDWTFNKSGYEGAIALTTETPQSSLERRLIFEYDLSRVSLEPPVSAVLTFTLRGPPVLPFPDTRVHVYSYPADLLEKPEDYFAEPAELQGSATVGGYQPPTVYRIDVTKPVNKALRSNHDQVAFRFQVNPNTPHDRNQAFMDALDTQPKTKPYITIRPAPQGSREPPTIGSTSGP